ncbi:MAG: SH3 domain-containing protein [Chloroflexi bacterium]|nr:SH3 domain-containing protein [Chloroflexota bacterium]
MTSRFYKISAALLIVLGGLFLVFLTPTAHTVLAQQPTGSVPTVTGTPLGPYVIVNSDVDFVNVRTGPSEYFYPKIGILMRGQTASALARSPDLSWIQIRYIGVPGNVGWIYAPNVRLVSSGFLTIVEPPPTSTPPATPTINPTLVSAFVAPQTPTRLPTFTPPVLVENPVFSDVSETPSRIPLGLIVLSLGFIGALIAIFSLLRGR